MLNYLKKAAGLKTTENGALTNISTSSSVLDLFALGGAVRNRGVQEVRDLIDSAWKEDKMMALRAIMFLSDIRQGQGERDFFKTSISYIIQHEPLLAAKLLELIPEYSRWDLVYEYVGTSLEVSMFRFIKEQFTKDLSAPNPSLLGKWLKSANTSSEESRKLGRATAAAFGMTEKQYRKALSTLRAKIGVVEKSMSAQEWEKIEVSTLPGMAYSRYMQAWKRHIPAKLERYLTDVSEGKVEMKTSVLYPHNVMKAAIAAYAQDYDYRHGSFSLRINDPIALKSAQLQWENLPDYVAGEKEYIIPVIDTSGSMETNIDSGSTTAMLVAQSLGIYLSERLAGPFKDHYITFSEMPILAKLKGEDIARKYLNMEAIISSTNIEAVFSLILDTAIKNKVSVEEMPSKIVIFSDMEFNQAVKGRADVTLFDSVKERFEAAGYSMPQVIFWNLCARHDQFPVNSHETGTALVSGYSPVTFKFMLGEKIPSPYENMLKVLNQPRYAVLDKLFE